MDLIIAREYITHGMRARASELATEWLGPRTEREIEASLTLEVTQERWTSLNAAIRQELKDGAIDVNTWPGDARLAERAAIIGRLNHLSTMVLAEKTQPGVWRVSADAPEILRAMSERGDIVRTLQRVCGNGRSRQRQPESSQFPIFCIGQRSMALGFRGSTANRFNWRVDDSQCWMTAWAFRWRPWRPVIEKRLGQQLSAARRWGSHQLGARASTIALVVMARFCAAQGSSSMSLLRAAVRHFETFGRRKPTSCARPGRHRWRTDSSGNQCNLIADYP